MSAAASPALAEFQAGFVRLLLAPDGAAPAGSGVPASLEALARQPAFAVHRNTVRKGCIDALEANHPAVVRLVGVPWFRAAAALHVANEPPRDGRLLGYGAGFADFLAGFEPAAALPYLSGVARLDRCWTESHVAADGDCLDGARLAGLAPEALGALRVVPHPAARWAWFDDLPIRSIWRRNRCDMADDRDDRDDRDGHDGGTELAWHGEGALLTRPVDTVTWHAIDRAEVAFLDACAAGGSLAEAARAAARARCDVDLTMLFAQLLQADALACHDSGSAFT